MGARIQRFERRVALALASGALGVTLLAAPATAKNDQIVYMDGRTVTGVEILKETIEEVRVKQLGNLRARESYGKGEAAYFAGQYEAAVSSFQSAYSEGGEEWVKPYALYYEAESLRKWGGVSADKGKLSRAADRYRSFISEFPDHFLLGAVRWGLGDALLQAGNAGEAQSEFAQVADRKYGDYWELWGKLGKGSCTPRRAPRSRS
ncbi:MAG: tetratricopeptide repeat protein [Planctomycetota bacterium]|jgi:tetratricopeptide (TPR) repeat protein